MFDAQNNKLLLIGFEILNVIYGIFSNSRLLLSSLFTNVIGHYYERGMSSSYSDRIIDFFGNRAPPKLLKIGHK